MLFRCNAYLAPYEDGQPNQNWISAHKDFTDFSILAPDSRFPYPHLAVAGGNMCTQALIDDQMQYVQGVTISLGKSWSLIGLTVS